MDNFILGETIENYKLTPPIKGVVKDNAIIVRHIGSLLVRKIKVEVSAGMEKFELEWMVENVRRPLLAMPVSELPASTLLTNTKIVI